MFLLLLSGHHTQNRSQRELPQFSRKTRGAACLSLSLVAIHSSYKISWNKAYQIHLLSSTSTANYIFITVHASPKKIPPNSGCPSESPLVYLALQRRSRPPLEHIDKAAWHRGPSRHRSLPSHTSGKGYGNHGRGTKSKQRWLVEM